jgi:hypothetical protein
MRACREGREPYDIGGDPQERSDDTVKPRLDHVSGGYAITLVRPASPSCDPRIEFAASLTLAEISPGTEFSRTTALYSLTRTCAQYGVPPLPYFTDVLTKLANGWTVNRLDELLPDQWRPAALSERPMDVPPPPSAATSLAVIEGSIS